MEKNQGGQKFLSLLLSVLMAVCVAIPFFTLFTGNGTYSWQFHNPATGKMMAETILLFLMIGGVLLRFKSPAAKWGAAGAVCLFFIYIHVVLLPVFISGLYLGYLLLAGRAVRAFLRDRFFQKREIRDRWMADFLLGSSLVLVCFCLLSAFQIGSIRQLRLFVCSTGILLYLWAGLSCLRQIRCKRQSGERGEEKLPRYHVEGKRKTSRGFCLLLTFTIVMVLIQAGRMNITLDFDTLWYGIRSEYVLDNGRGIYENPGMVGMAYVYAKGLETLVLPLSGLASYSYLLAFNLWLSVLGLFGVYQLACLYMDRELALFAPALTSCIPGIMNMAVSAKPDVITWVIQIFMVYYMALYIKETGEGKEKPFAFLAMSGGAYLLSLTMKSTSLVFSTAIFGMSGLYLIARRLLRLAAPVREWLLLFFPAGALMGIWARTMMITGMPVTSVFTSVFEKLGFRMKYPFASSGLPQNWEEASNGEVLIRRLYHMLLMPTGEDMEHVVFAWGSPLMFFFAGVCGVCGILFLLKKEKKKSRDNSLKLYAHVVFWPFLATNLVSLVMLYQIDGNYFMLLYTGVLLGGLSLLSSLRERGFSIVSQVSRRLLIPLMVFNLLLTAESNWAWSLGFSPIQWINNGRVNHRAMQHEKMVEKGNEQIWNILAEDPSTRVIAFGDHPGCLQFPCVVQSYKDITSPWGNVELVNTVEAFEEYMAYARTDYAYVEAGFIGEESWEWSYGLVREMIERGTLTDLKFENGNVLARVNLDGQRTKQSEENLKIFDEYYITYERMHGVTA